MACSEGAPSSSLTTHLTLRVKDCLPPESKNVGAKEVCADVSKQRLGKEETAAGVPEVPKRREAPGSG